ncbi:WXG100 family type VII secretion target [Nonomuraea sp. NPDC050691]|uniref:WXG100 family type VII secretion target n=1 Tax=Nonomuraea sp. NPDC050691 TaxID=3155661 RepID=UPI0033FEE45A
MAEPTGVDAALSAHAATSLVKAAGYCQNTAQYIEGMRQRVAGIKAEIMTKWEGDAARAFGGALDQWDVEFKQVRQILESIYDKLNINAKVYSEANDHNMDLARGLVNAGEGGRIDTLINSSNRN